MGVIGIVGGQALSTAAILAFILAPYQAFAYYNDALKSHYFERVKAADGSDDKFQGNLQSELRMKFNSRQPFSQRYCSSVAYSLLSTFCCCLATRWE